MITDVMVSWLDYRIVSLGSRVMDYYTKISLYRETSVREYWIVDPMKQTIPVYEMDKDSTSTIHFFLIQLVTGESKVLKKTLLFLSYPDKFSVQFFLFHTTSGTLTFWSMQWLFFVVVSHFYNCFPHSFICGFKL